MDWPEVGTPLDHATVMVMVEPAHRALLGPDPWRSVATAAELVGAIDAAACEAFPEYARRYRVQ